MARALILVLALLLPGGLSAQAWDPAAAGRMLAAMDLAASHGLPPERYGRAALARALASGDAAEAAILADSGFRRLATDLLQGAAPPSARKAWHIPSTDAANQARLDAAVRQALETGGVAHVLDGLAPDHPHYGALRQALATEPPGPRRLAILASLERWRWMPRRIEGRHLFVQVPAFEARLMDGSDITAIHRVIVGKRRTPTPQFAAVIAGVILNPEWIVPKSIEAEGIGRLLATNPKLAAARGYRRTASGVVQAPGPQNQLGQMKLRMPNPHSVYLHDTPSKALFDRKDRALSHGCIRTHDPLGLAARLLAGAQGWSRARIDAAVAAGTTVDVPVHPPVPVFIVYFTAEPDAAGRIRVHPDLYGRDAPILAALDVSR
jgi:murein L,D-transpeptidase YcbB/YkuD